MGLLDSIKFSTGNPEQDAQLNRGLIAAGLQLMQARGRLFPAIGQAGMMGLQAADQTRQQQMQAQEQAQRRQMMGLQIGQAQREAQIAALPGQFYRAPSQPVMDATGGMETAVEAPNNASGPGGFDLAGYMNALRGMDFGKYLQTAAALRTDKTKPVALGRDQRLVNPETGAEMIPAMPDDPKSKSADLQAYAQVVQDYAAEGRKPPTFEQWDLARKRAGATNVATYGSPTAAQFVHPVTGQPMTAFAQFGNKPGAPPQIAVLGADQIAAATRPGAVPLSPVTTPKEMTEGQAKANLFGTRAKEADATIGGLARAGVIAPSLAQQATGGEGMTGALATALATPQQQQVDQAQRDFINAVLRRESGAVIAIPEMANARKQYFPMPGDSPEVIAQKARNRQVAIAGILAEVPEAKRGAGVSAPMANNTDPLGLRK